MIYYNETTKQGIKIVNTTDNFKAASLKYKEYLTS